MEEISHKDQKNRKEIRTFFTSQVAKGTGVSTLYNKITPSTLFNEASLDALDLAESGRSARIAKDEPSIAHDTAAYMITIVIQITIYIFHNGM